MNKATMLLTAVLATSLAGCGRQEAPEPPVISAAPAVTASVTTAPTAAPVPDPTPAPTPDSTPEPAAASEDRPEPSGALSPELKKKEKDSEPSVGPLQVPEMSDQPAPVPTEQVSETAPPAEVKVPGSEEFITAEEIDPLSTPESTAVIRTGVPSDTEVLQAYQDAEEAYHWFVMNTLPSSSENIRIIDHTIYSQVTDDRFPTLESLRAYLKSLFSDEVVDRLLPADGTQYVNIGGSLYVSNGARGADLTKGGLTLVALWPEGDPSPRKCTVQATVELLDFDENGKSFVTGQQVYSFPYEKVGDKWVFTSFESIF